MYGELVMPYMVNFGMESERIRKASVYPNDLCT